MEHSPPAPSTPSHTPPPHESTPTHSPLPKGVELATPPHEDVSLCSNNSDYTTGPKTPPPETTPTYPIGPSTPPILLQLTSDPLTTPTVQHMNVSDISSDMEGSIDQSAEVVRPLSPPVPMVTESTPESSEVIGEVPHPFSPSAKTPMKRKVCYLLLFFCTRRTKE